MVKERVLAVPDTTIFIAELPEATRNIIREDLRQHARENQYRLKWDSEAGDYAGMARRFCDISDMYMYTNLKFCEPGEDVVAYERSLQRNITLKLTEDDVTELCKKVGKCGLTVSQLLESFVSDLIGGSKTNGSDERMYANQWFNRCWFSFVPDQTFLQYLIEWGSVDDILDTWEELQNYEGQETLEDYEQEELEMLKNYINETFEEYQRDNSEPEDATLEEGIAKVLEWNKERQEMLSGISVERAKER